jgi:hypothetical protein
MQRPDVLSRTVESREHNVLATNWVYLDRTGRIRPSAALCGELGLRAEPDRKLSQRLGLKGVIIKCEGLQATHQEEQKVLKAIHPVPACTSLTSWLLAAALGFTLFGTCSASVITGPSAARSISLHMCSHKSLLKFSQRNL